jgi:hypothetical protein
MSKTTCSPSASQLVLGAILALSLAPQFARAAPNSITVTKTQNLDFGSFAVLPSCSGCTITIASNGQRTASAGIALSSTNMGKAAQFNVTCNNITCAYTVSAPAGVTIAAGIVNMTVGTYTPVRTPTSTPSTLTVGATLTIPNSGSAPNTYTKNFTVITSP